MKKENELSKISYYYEMFMERAYGIYESSTPWMQASVMHNLIIAEKGRVISVESVAHFEEQISEVKKYMGNAMDQYLAKPNLPKEIADTLKGYKEEIVWTVSSDELIGIVLKTIDLTVSIPIDME